jgi:putative membrane protein
MTETGERNAGAATERTRGEGGAGMKRRGSVTDSCARALIWGSARPSSMATPLPATPSWQDDSGAQRQRRLWIYLLVVGVAAAGGVVLLGISLFPTVFGLPHYGPGVPLGGGFLGLLLLLWAVMFGLRIALRMSLRSGTRGAGRRDPALFIARRRYARGEITREQYEQIVRDLGRPPGGP